MSLKVTRATDYAVRAMIHLACLPEGNLALRDDIAQAQGVPSSFMAKILRNLVREDLLHSSRGVNGGFSLSREPSTISLLQVVEAIEGPLSLTSCCGGGRGCQYTSDCPAAPIWATVQESIRTILGDTSLEKLVSTPRRNGRVAQPLVEAPCDPKALCGV